MVERLYLTVMIALVLALAPALGAGQSAKPSSAAQKAELGKDEITLLMVQVSRMPVEQQGRRMEMIWDHLETSQTPRSDFLFCTGLAYLGDYKAQACLGNAFEKGRVAQKDAASAYVWYAIAFDNPIDDPAIRQKIRTDRDRIKNAVLSASPARTEKELTDLVKLQKALRMQYLAEIRNAGD